MKLNGSWMKGVMGVGREMLLELGIPHFKSKGTEGGICSAGGEEKQLKEANMLKY